MLMSAYGITELCGTVIFTELDDPWTHACARAGGPSPGFEVKVVDPETGAELGPGRRGELIGRGPSRFVGYFRNDDQTRAVIDDEGFFHTGDLCSIDADGRVEFHGRMKDMLKVEARTSRRSRSSRSWPRIRRSRWPRSSESPTRG